MKDFEVSLTELEYERLPPALRRKYFSSLERLRLAHDGVYPSRFPREPQRPLTSSNASSLSTSRSTRRPSTALDGRSISPSSSTTRTRLRKSSRRVSVTPQQVTDFASLPPVLQRKYFSREEQILLTSRINHVIVDAADEALYREYRRKSQPAPRIIENQSEDSLEFTDVESSDEMDLNSQDLNGFRWLHGEDDLDLSLYDYHAAVTETAQSDHASPRLSHLRRGLMMSNVSFHRRSSSTNSLGGQSSWPLSSTMSSPLAKSQRSVSTTVPSGHRKNRASTSSLDPGAAHYQDPAARMKLRVYLASPQKFDEAIEFGFPSIQEPTTSRLVRPGTASRSTESSPETRFSDDTPSLSDGDEHDVEDIDSPRTPDLASCSSAFSKSNKSSLDRPTFKPRIVRDFLDPYVSASTSNREMTLHMTLTRPDLRSPEELSPTCDINSLPLEQAPLHVAESTAVFWDSLPEEQGTMRKLLKKFKLRA